MKLLLSIATITLMSTFAFADHHDKGGGGPCAKDRETLCKGVEQGQGHVMKCMRDNHDKLSVECKAHMAKMKGAMKEAKEACHADVEQFCGDVEMGHGRILKCLRDNKEKLSDACKESFEDMKKMRKDAKKAGA